MSTLLFRYEKGRGVSQNHIESFKYYYLSAESGSPDGKVGLGNRYEVRYFKNRFEYQLLALGILQKQNDCIRKLQSLMKHHWLIYILVTW